MPNSGKTPVNLATPLTPQTASACGSLSDPTARVLGSFYPALTFCKQQRNTNPKPQKPLPHSDWTVLVSLPSVLSPEAHPNSAWCVQKVSGCFSMKQTFLCAPGGVVCRRWMSWLKRPGQTAAFMLRTCQSIYSSTMQVRSHGQAVSTDTDRPACWRLAVRPLPWRCQR
jgi:hypothetical protein